MYLITEMKDLMPKLIKDMPSLKKLKEDGGINTTSKNVLTDKETETVDELK